MKLIPKLTHWLMLHLLQRSWLWFSSPPITSNWDVELMKLLRLWTAVCRNLSWWQLMRSHWRYCSTYHCCVKTRTSLTSLFVRSKPWEELAVFRDPLLRVLLPQMKGHSWSHKSQPFSKKSKSCWSKMSHLWISGRIRNKTFSFHLHKYFPK